MPPLRKPIIRPPAKVAPKVAPKPTVKSAPAAAPANDGFARARTLNEERQRAADLRANRPFSFRMKVGEGGEKGVTVVFTDKTKMPAMPFFHHQHHWGYEENDSKSDECIQDSPEGCPLCKELGKKGGWELALTCIDARPYTPKNGPNAGKPQTGKRRMLFEVKTSMIPKFERLYKEHKTFRGMVVRMFRDNKKEAAIGSDVKFVKMLSEAELLKYCGKPEVAEPVDMKKAFPRPTYDELAKRHNISTGDDGAVGSEDVGDDSIPF